VVAAVLLVVVGRILQESQRIQSNTTDFFIVSSTTCFGPMAHHQVGKKFNVRDTLNNLVHFKVSKKIRVTIK
jgi:hypothetical protein